MGCNVSLSELRQIRERLRRQHGLPLSTCQLELSLLRQLPVTSGMLAACHEMGIVVLAYSPLGMGRLTGKYDVMRGEWPFWGQKGRSPAHQQQRPFGTSLDEDPK